MTTAHDGGKVVSLTHRPPLHPRKYSWYSFLLEAESTRGPYCDRKDFMSTKNSNDTSWDRTSDLPICSTALCYRGPHYVTRILCQRKIPMTPAGIEPATFRFVAQHCATAVPIMLLEFCQWKIPMTPAGIEPATFRFVAQRCATAVPIMLLECYVNEKFQWHQLGSNQRPSDLLHIALTTVPPRSSLCY